MLSFDILLFINLGMQRMDVGDYSRISEVDECVIYELSIDGAWVEDGEVGIFYARRVEVRVREGAGV
jgi:hypothetical protein